VLDARVTTMRCATNRGLLNQTDKQERASEAGDGDRTAATFFQRARRGWFVDVPCLPALTELNAWVRNAGDAPLLVLDAAQGSTR
jgi:hypothetical protein